MVGCGPGGACCESCRRSPLVSPPVSLGAGFGFWAELAQVAVEYASQRASNKPANYTGPTADQIAQQLIAEQRATTSSPAALLKSPLTLAGLGAVALAFVLSR